MADMVDKKLLTGIPHNDCSGIQAGAGGGRKGASHDSQSVYW